MLTDEQVNELYTALQADGYVPATAEALANHGVTVEKAKLLSKSEILEHYLEWNGLIGWTNQILNVLENAEENCNL